MPLACIIVIQTATLINIPVLKLHMTVQAELVIIRDARPVDYDHLYVKIWQNVCRTCVK